MSANTLNYIETAQPVHDFAKTEFAPVINGNSSTSGVFAGLIESERKMVDRMAKETALTLQIAEKLQKSFTEIEIYSYKLYLEMLLREQKNYRERFGRWTAYFVAPLFLIGFVVLSDQRGAFLLAALLTVIPAILFLNHRFGKVNNFARTLKIACEFVEINEKHRAK